MVGRLTTHVLDTAQGRPGAGIRIELYRLAPEPHRVADTTTNDDGRTDAPLLEGEALTTGSYELIFHAGAYFRSSGMASSTPFLDQVVVRFLIAAEDEHYHVPLLLAPYGYSTYRGS